MLLRFCFFACLLRIARAFRNTNIHDVQRYLDCPFHKLQESEFACHRYSMDKTNRILSFQSPPIFNFHDTAIQKKLTNKTFVFFGDSLMRNQFVSLACLLWEFDTSLTENSLDLTLRFPQIYSSRLDFELLHFNHHFVLDGTLSEILFSAHSLRLDYNIRRILEGVYGRHRRPPDLALVSIGHHYTIGKYNSSCHAKVGCDPTSLNWDRFATTIKGLNKILLNISVETKTKIVWRSVPARHYENGEWNTEGVCGSQKPCFHDLEVNLNNPASSYYKSFKASEILRESAKEFNMPYIDVSRNSLDRCDGHISNVKGRVGAAREDCSHYCVPGVPDMWHDELLTV